MRNRGCNDVLIAVVDGLKGLPEAINTAFAKITVQTCIVHQVRTCLDYAGWKDRKTSAAALRKSYTAATAEAAAKELDEFEDSELGKQFSIVVKSWRSTWERVIPFFAFPPNIRRVIYTSSTIESLNTQLRKIIKNRRHFPNEDAAIKLRWLPLRNIANKTVRNAFEWKPALKEFAIHFEDRFEINHV